MFNRQNTRCWAGENQGLEREDESLDGTPAHTSRVGTYYLRECSGRTGGNQFLMTSQVA